MEVMASPYKHATDSPSKQLLYELGQLRITTQEDFYARLDRENHEREVAHRAALAAAAAEHDRVRHSAEVEREKLELQIEAERRRREDEDKKELDRKRHEKTLREIEDKRREIERAKTAELEEQRANQVRQAEADAAERKRQQDKDKRDAEAARRLADDQAAEAKAKATAVAAQKALEAQQAEAQNTARKPAQAQGVLATAQTTPRNPEKESEQQRYREVHHRLKDLRKFMATSAKQTPTLKKRMGDMRREIKKCVGQLTDGKGANRTPLQQIISVLKESATVSEPKIDYRLFLASPPENVEDFRGPALLLYQLNIFSKAIISQFIDEAGVSPKAADPVGIIASHIFALSEFKRNGISMIDVLLAKFHVVCPVLWGIYGDENSAEGRSRLGWWREEQDGPWVSDQRHSERMTGLGAGFAAISLRNYEKARLENPLPTWHYWRSMASIVNVPPREATQTHFIVLKAMIENYETKFLEFYGDAALAALRKALVDFPREVEDKSVAAKAVAILPDVLKRDKKLTL